MSAVACATSDLPNKTERNKELGKQQDKKKSKNKIKEKNQVYNIYILNM